MARGTPSMLALLGLLAVAGYQNRDKIKDMLDNNNQRTPGTGGNEQPMSGGLGGILGGLTGMLGGGAAGSSGNVLTSGLDGLVDKFKQAGKGDVAESWVAKGPNKPISPDQLASTLDEDDIRMLTEKTGLSREELLSRLSQTLPEAVDQYTPDGKIT